MDRKVISLDSLPFEIIEIILRYDCITFVDICRLSTISRLLNCIGKSNKLWKEKYAAMWPESVSLYDEFSTNWKNEFCFRFQFRKKIRKALEAIAVEYYYQDNVPNDPFVHLREVYGNDPLSDHIFTNELENIIYFSENYNDLTIKYYAKRALRYMRHSLLETVWREALADNEKKLTLLKGACLVSQWNQPTNRRCTKNVTNQVNTIAKNVFDLIKSVSPNHPVIKRGLPIMENENGEVLDQSCWTPAQCKVILCAINEVMFYNEKFCGCLDIFYNENNSYIDKVLQYKIGIPVSLGIVYEAVAAQLGVCCLPVNFPGHFLLKWKEHPHYVGPDAFTFIDVHQRGTFKTIKELDDLAPGYETFSPSWLEAVPPTKVFIRMCWNLVEVARQRDGEGEGLLCLCNALELLSILSPDDMEHKLLLARVYMHLCINMRRVISLLQEISDQDPASTGIVSYMYRSAITTLESQKARLRVKNVKEQPRSENCIVKFAVGMVMKHKKYNYRCVIYGWDSVCTASEDWIKQMGVYNLPHQDKQPFYHVLVEDGTNRYAAEENLEIDTIPNTPVEHSEVGKFFESFHSQYYLPNKQKLLEYPDDIAAREKALAI